MALDGIFLHHLKNEIEAFAVGARIEKIYQPSKEELVFSLRSREGAKKLLLSCRADSARIHYTDFPPENPSKPPMLCMLFRKHLTSSKITAVTQNGLERIVKISVDAINELGDSVTLTIVVEIMGRYSNVILLNENGRIIDALKRIDESKSQVRCILPGETYVEPPAQDKLNLFNDDIEQIKNRIYKSNKTLSNAFQDAVLGVSPIVCREYENGITIEKIKSYAENPTPVAVINDTPMDFAFMPITQYGSLVELKEFDSFSALLDFFYYEKVRADRIRQRSGDLFKKLQNLQERAVRKAVNREKELQDCKDKDKYRIFGDLLSTNQYNLQKGAPYYDLENYYDNCNIIRVPADVTLSPSQNAQKYYKEYRKKQVAETKLNDFIEEAKKEAEYLETVIDSLSRAETDSEITEIRNELAETGYLKRRNDKKAKNTKALKPMEFETEEGFKIFVGRNNIMNDRLTLKTSKNYDLWFHTKDTPGSHVVVQNDGREFTDKVIREAAMLAAKNSKAGNSSNVPVDYTIIKNVKKPSGAKPGMVIYVDYKTEFVTPNAAELERIKRIV
ncbi:MAG: NFACT family protein [Eubacterium sp.]|nr:NFACT family protein [Eubacterium sp.]